MPELSKKVRGRGRDRGRHACPRREKSIPPINSLTTYPFHPTWTGGGGGGAARAPAVAQDGGLPPVNCRDRVLGWGDV